MSLGSPAIPPIHFRLEECSYRCWLVATPPRSAVLLDLNSAFKMIDILHRVFQSLERNLILSSARVFSCEFNYLSMAAESSMSDSFEFIYSRAFKRPHRNLKYIFKKARVQTFSWCIRWSQGRICPYRCGSVPGCFGAWQMHRRRSQWSFGRAHLWESPPARLLKNQLTCFSFQFKWRYLTPWFLKWFINSLCAQLMF